ncbi:MAG: sigma-54-dependent Fis family transcriptional regulator [Fibrobacteres bacterium]|nr:sigma-54-dependent Fis family transcriptional regulator [Fibrobacterota bacterium]
MDKQLIFENHPSLTWCIEINTMSVVEVNKAARNSMPLALDLITGTKLGQILIPVKWFEDDSWNLEEKLLNGHTFRCVISPDYRKKGDVAGEEDFRFRAIPIKGDDNYLYVVFERPINPVLRRFVASLKDFMVVLDPHKNIVETTSNNYTLQLFRGGRFLGRPLEEFLGADGYGRLKKRSEDFRINATEYRKMITIWKPKYSGRSDVLNEWIIDLTKPDLRIDSAQNIKLISADNPVYFYCKEPFDSTNESIGISVNVNGWKSASRVAAIFNQNIPSDWDYTGYNAGMRFADGEVIFTLKRNSDFIFWESVKCHLPECFVYRVEKTGPVFTFIVDGRVQATCIDEHPLEEPGAYAGIMGVGSISVQKLSVELPAVDYNPLPLPAPVKLEISGLSGSIYEASIVPLITWGGYNAPLKGEGILFRDVTIRTKLENERESLIKDKERLATGDFFGFIGTSAEIRKIIDMAERFAESKASMLILGPTGSGKGVLAQAIHKRSGRCDKPFVKIDCSSIPESLLDSELFGHEKGSFTGAHERKKGRLESADGGTVFLDEIGNIPMSVQAKLLGFLEDQRFTRVGGDREIKVDVRIISATNADLQTMIKSGRFRQDLYFRLNAVSIEIPPLSERIEDIPVLVEGMMQEINREHGLAINGISRETINSLMVREWPGNVRELRHVISSLAIRTKNGIISEVPAEERYERAAIRKKVFVNESDREASVIEFAKKQSHFSARDCLAVLPVSLPTIQRDLRRLVESGKLKSVGRGPAVRYTMQ